MFRIYVCQRGIESIACGVMLGAILYHNDYYPEFDQILGSQIGSKKANRLSTNLFDKYDAVFELVSFEFCELELYRRIRVKTENLIFNLISKLGINLDNCEIVLDVKLPNISFGKVKRANSVKQYPALHLTRNILEMERCSEVNKLSILYPIYRLQYNQGRITPTHVDLILRYKPSIIHRPNTLEYISNYIINTVINEQKKDTIYKSTFLTARLPQWIIEYYKQNHNKTIIYFKDLVSDRQLSKISKHKLSNTSELRSATHKSIANNIPDDMNEWLISNAPPDLKHEILL
jgi:hypothetical protein